MQSPNTREYTLLHALDVVTPIPSVNPSIIPETPEATPRDAPSLPESSPGGGASDQHRPSDSASEVDDHISEPHSGSGHTLTVHHFVCDPNGRLISVQLHNASFVSLYRTGRTEEFFVRSGALSSRSSSLPFCLLSSALSSLSGTSTL
jgi:hypothetical protein